MYVCMCACVQSFPPIFEFQITGRRIGCTGILHIIYNLTDGGGDHTQSSGGTDSEARTA